MDRITRIISRLDSKLNKIFDEQEIKKFDANISNAYEIKYKFSFEYDTGYIEYKRTLSSYLNKKEKLLRQILWRISESISFSNVKKPTCYYIIGLEDDGKSSNQCEEEFDKSLKIILDSIINTCIKYKYTYLYNKLNKSYLLVIKFWIEDDSIDFDF